MQASRNSIFAGKPVRSTNLAGHSLLQRRCACGASGGKDGECEECKKKTGATLQRRAANASEPTSVPPIVHEVLSSPGQPLDPGTRAFLEPRFGHDFSKVRIHTSEKAADSARQVNALAYTVGRDVVFAAGHYSPETREGRRLIAHELAHVVQQDFRNSRNAAISEVGRTGDRYELEADRAASSTSESSALPSDRFVAANERPALQRHNRLAIQRQVFGKPTPVEVRSPVFEELATQESTIASGISGRSLSDPEVKLARGVFGESIDYSRVRLLPTSISLLEFRTVPNVIRVPKKFSISDARDAETFIHELTHVWQYQHGGTSYISGALQANIAGMIGKGNRDAAYCYNLVPGRKFFEFKPEQQGMIVENYFIMNRDLGSTDKTGSFRQNSWVCPGSPKVSWATRQAEISSELPLYEALIKQMQAALPRPETELLMDRARDVMQTPDERIPSGPDDRRLAPLKPVLELRF